MNENHNFSANPNSTTATYFELPQASQNFVLSQSSYVRVLECACMLQSAMKYLRRWCKGTHDGAGTRPLAVRGAKPSHHTLQAHGVKFRHLCLCTSGTFSGGYLFDVLWCKGTYDGVGTRPLAVCGAKASHHTLQAHGVKFRHLCLCTS